MRLRRSTCVALVSFLACIPIATSWASVRLPSRFTWFSGSNSAATGVYTGDVNGDGWPDVLTRNATVGNFSLQLGGPGGSLHLFGNMTLDSNPTDVRLVKVDGDNRADLVIANYSTNTVTLRSGLAGGGFGPPRTIATPSRPNAIECADLNGDGRTDLVVATFTETKVRVYLQQPDGSFSLSATMIAPSSPSSVVVADFDENGAPDVLVLGSTSFRTYYSAGDGTFPGMNAFGSGGSRALIGDFNHDGIPDVAIGGSDAISIYLGNASVSFEPKITLAAGLNPTLAAVGDWNGDGYDDLALFVVPAGPGQLRVYGGGAPPSFSQLSVVPGRGALAAAADFDADGKLDIVSAGGFIGDDVARGNGDGTFGDAPDGEVSIPGSVVQLEFGDLDGDGHPDMAALADGAVYPCSLSPAGQLTPLSTVPTAAIHMMLRDMNDDGRADIVSLQSQSYANPWGAVQVWLSQSNGTFLAQPAQLTSTYNPYSLATGPVNGDAAPDVVVAESGAISTLLGLGNGSLGPISNPESAVFPLKVVLDDLNGDGHPEAVVQDNNQISVYPGITGTYFEPGVVEIPGPALLADVSDLDGDGKPDILVWDATNSRFQLYPGDGAGNLGSPIAFTGSTSSNALFADMDGDGVIDEIDHYDGGPLLRILQGHEGFVFGPEEEDFGLDAVGVPHIKDLNGDGAPDVAFVGGGEIQILLQKNASVSADRRLPARVSLAAYPNPARGAMSFAYTMTRSGNVRLGIYDPHGRLIRELVSGTKEAGSYRQPWDGKDGAGVRAPAGVYFARGVFAEQTALAKVVVMN